MKLKLEYGAFLLSMSFISSLMIVGIGKFVIAFLDLVSMYLSLRAF